MTGLTKRGATALAMALAVILIGVTAFVYASIIGSHDEPDLDSLLGQPRIEMMSEDSGEWLERHFYDANGVERKAEVVYRNGDVGVRIWRADKTLARESVTTKDGKVMESAEFAADGKQVLKGFALRADGTTAWEAKPIGTNVETTMYWSSGKLFGRQIRRAGGKPFRGTYYREDGTLWLEQSGMVEVLFRVSVWRVQNETVYNGAGTVKIFTSFYNDMNGSTTDSWFSEVDGSLRYQQWWRDYAFGRTLTEEDEGAPERVMLQAEIHNPAPGIVKEAVMMSSDGYVVERVVDTLADGSKREYIVLYDRTITNINVYDAQGKLLRTEKPSRGARKDVSDVLTEDEPSAVDALEKWIDENKSLVHRLPAVRSE